MLDRPFLFACYGGGHVNALVPVIKHLASQGYSVLCIGLTTGHRSFLDQGIDAKSVEIVDPVKSQDSKRVEKFLADDNSFSSGPVPLEQSRHYHRIGLE